MHLEVVPPTAGGVELEHVVGVAPLQDAPIDPADGVARFEYGYKGGGVEDGVDHWQHAGFSLS